MRLFKIAFVISLAFPVSGIANAQDIWMNLFVLSGSMSEITTSDLDRLVEAGASGVELQGTTASIEDCRRVGAYLQANNIPSSLNVAALPEVDPSSLTTEGRITGENYLNSRIDCAKALGSEIIAGPFILPLGYWPEKTGKELQHYINQKLNSATEVIRRASSYAASKGIKLAYEPLTRWEMPGLNTLKETISYLKKVNHPNLGVTVDISHEVLDGEGPEIFAKQIQWLAENQKLMHVHVSAPHRGLLAESWLPWESFFAPIKPYWNGKPIVIEIMNGIAPFAQPSGKGLRLTRNAFNDPFEVARTSIKTTKAKWEAVVAAK